MSSTTHFLDDDRDRAMTAQEIIDKHGRGVIEAMAADGNVGAEAVLDVVDGETGGESDGE